MEGAAVKDPKDDKITNKDDSVTNKDGDNNLEKGKQLSDQNDADKKDVKAVTSSNDNPELYETADESSNEARELSGENL
jgi:hypothetical protein